ncbi:hypothetical protein TGAM01_v207736 [Trichoderma gamsii]|uniref:Uncharacterized protein n=1 Tax=Trichoderma gamsii TaxID=398673 RepID=A0A2P4ZGU3_9HYPO|nr:hypothetical protein TGAM01_v207736 [Trichoderma gamsii]PON23502.1 hypothetical protein TGAM01_v207736 [Trichoderma gamsii]
MFTYRGRGGPSRSTPANVQCQKSRHYSYECKSSSQERPYVSRPSRSQQLRNPKLVPKLTSDTPNPLEKKKGVADQELAKLEAERERKRELEDREDELLDAGSRRRRSVSSHSVSTISTDASRDSRSPPPRRRTRSPAAKRRDHSPKSASNRSYSADSASDRSYSRSPSPPRRQRRIDPGSPLVLEEMMSRPLGNGMIKGLGDVMANGGVIQTRDRGHRSEMTGHIEGEMMTTDRVADVVAVVIRDTGECLPETRPESEV